jgi:hypothetical protein
MSNSPLIASVITDYVPVGQSRRLGVIGLSAPSESERCFECSVSLSDRATPYQIYGENSLQSIGLAFAFLRTRIKDMESKGDLFYFPDTEDLIPFDAYFPSA